MAHSTRKQLFRLEEGHMDVSESGELLVIFPVVLISLLLLVLIDRIGLIKGNLEDEEEEI